MVLALKLAALNQLKDHPLLQADAGLDTTAYVELARQVLAGDISLGPGLYYVSPLYIYFLAGGLAVFDSFTAVRVVQTVLGTIAVGLIFVMAREWFSERAGWIAAALATLTGLFTFYESLILQASIDAFLTAAALLALTVGLKRNGLLWVIVAGVTFGVATLNRPNMPLAVAVVAAALLAVRRVRPAGVLLAGLLLGMAPAAVRNVVVAGQWSLVSSHGGLNFYIGNSEGATGFSRPVSGVRPTIVGQEKDTKRVAEQALGHPVTEAETSGYFFGLAWKWIREHPADALTLFARKIGSVFSAQHVALPHSYPFYAYDANTLLRFLVVGPWLLIPLGVVGLVFFAPARHHREYLPWVVFIPGYAFAVAAFFVAERYRLPLFVPLCVGAGAAVDRALRLRPRQLLAPAIAFVVLFAFVNWPRDLSDGRWEEGLRMAQRFVILGQYDEADRWVGRISKREPYAGATQYGVGAQLLQVGQTDRALAYLTEARRRAPNDARTSYALGQALLKAGRASEAVPHMRKGFEAGVELPLGGYEYAIALENTGDLAAASSVIRRITPAEADDPEPWLRLGRLAAKAGAPDVAERFFRRAVQIRPQDGNTRQQLGLNLVVLERYEEARIELSEAVRLNPGDADSLSRLAFCEFTLGRNAEARIHAEAALTVNPGDRLATELLTALRGR